MKKIITICDYCEKLIEKNPKFIQTGTEVEEDTYTQDEKDFRLDLCDDCFGAISSVLSTLILERRKDKEQSASDPEEEGAAEKQQESAEESVSLKQQEPAEEAQDQEPAEDGAALEQHDAAQEQQAPAKKTAAKNEVDHGRIVALYRAKPPRSIKWIAEDCKCSQQTVINHLVKEGLYKVKRKETEEEE